jgi:hypothetical protein
MSSKEKSLSISHLRWLGLSGLFRCAVVYSFHKIIEAFSKTGLGARGLRHKDFPSLPRFQLPLSLLSKYIAKITEDTVSYSECVAGVRFSAVPLSAIERSNKYRPTNQMR